MKSDSYMVVNLLISGVCCNPVILIFGIGLLSSMIRVIMEYQRGLHFRLGKLIGIKDPGLTIIVPVIDRLEIVDTRIQYVDIPRQETLTKDNISTILNAVVYFRIKDPTAAILNVQNYKAAIFQHGQAAMRDIAGSYELDSLLYEREKVANDIQKIISKETEQWGIEIISLNIQDIELPADMKKAIARQAQAERDKRATVIVSQGEVEAAKTMAEAAQIISSSHGALHLRTLQALSNLSADKTNTITYILPFEGQSLEKLDINENPGTTNSADTPLPRFSAKIRKEI